MSKSVGQQYPQDAEGSPVALSSSLSAQIRAKYLAGFRYQNIRLQKFLGFSFEF